MKAALYRCLFYLLLLPVSVWLFSGCDLVSGGEKDGAGDENLPALPVAGILVQSSWKFKAEELPPENVGQWVGKIASAISGSAEECRWQVEKLRGAEVHSCVTGKDASTRVFEFLKEGQPPVWTYLPAQPDRAFRLGRLGAAPTSALLSAERLGYFSNDGKKGLTYSWAGCFENSGPSELADIRMRLWLMLRDGSGRSFELAGKERKHTARSGIPRKLAAGEFFCTVLEVKGVPAEWLVLADVEAVAVIDSIWSDSRGFTHIGPVWRVAHDFSSLSGIDTEKTAVLIDANIYSSKPGKILRKIGTEAQLFDIDRQEGRWLRGKSADGLSGWVKADSAWSVFEDAVPTDDSSKAALVSLKIFLQNLLKMDCSAASPCFDGAAALNCAYSAGLRKARQSTELLFHPFRIKAESPDSVNVEAYFAVRSGEKAGRVFFLCFKLLKNGVSGRWVLAVSESDTALLNEFISDCLPDEP